MPSSTSATPPTRCQPGRSPSRSGCWPTTARSTPSAAIANSSEVERRHGPIRPRAAPAGRWSAALAGCLRLGVARRGRRAAGQTGWTLEAAFRRPCCHRAAPCGPSGGGEPNADDGASIASLAPWDGPAAIVFSDGRRVGAMLDRNGLRPLAFDVRDDGLVVAASEAGAFELPASEHRPTWPPRSGRDARRRARSPGSSTSRPTIDRASVTSSAADHGASADGRVTALAVAGPTAPPARHDGCPAALSRGTRRRALPPGHPDHGRRRPRAPLEHGRRHADAGLGADRPTGHRPPSPGVRAGHEPAHRRRPGAHRHRLRVELGPRPTTPRRPDRGRRDLLMRLDGPYVATIADLVAAAPWPFDDWIATWRASAGVAGLEAALERLAAAGCHPPVAVSGLLIMVSDDDFSLARLPIPSVLAVGAVHTSADRGRASRSRRPLVADAADILDVHAAAMAIAAGASAVHPGWPSSWPPSGRFARRRVAEPRGRDRAAHRRHSRPVCARRSPGWASATVASYVGGVAVRDARARREPSSRAASRRPRHGRAVSASTTSPRTQLRRAETARLVAPETPPARLIDPGRARFRADGETARYAPIVVQSSRASRPRPATAGARSAARSGYAAAAPAGRVTVRATPSSSAVGGACRSRGRDGAAIARRFVAAAMSVGALSPEAHQAITSACSAPAVPPTRVKAARTRPGIAPVTTASDATR